MAKDPAFLFYPGDWNLGTMHMNLLEKGAYIELLMLQFSRGKFTLAQAKHMLNGSFDLAWPTIKEKFKNEGEFFWNERLELEKFKRSKFTESRRNNGSKGKETKVKTKKKRSTSLASEKHMLRHMENENENENKDINTIEKGGQGEGSVYQKCMSLYFDFIKARTGVKPLIDPLQGKSLKGIIAYLGGLKDEYDEENIVKSWSYILKKWGNLDTYLGNKLKLSEILSELTNILNQIKNPKPKFNTPKTQEQKIQEYAELDILADRLIAIKNNNGAV